MFKPGHFTTGHFGPGHFVGNVGAIIAAVKEKFIGFVANIGTFMDR